MKRFLKFVVLALLGFLVFFYGAFALFLKWGEHVEKKAEAGQESLYEKSTEPHEVTLLDEGLLSFAERIKLIQGAKKTIELEFFIYNVDQSSRILTQELIKKANQGVKVRILVDFAAPVFKLAPHYVSFLKKSNIEVRYYNTSKFYQIFSFQHRSHRKLLVVDDAVLITGGRNIANEYFDLSETYNFLDSDVLLRGAMVKKIRASFDLYWDSKLSSQNTSATAYDSNEGVTEFFQVVDSDMALQKKVLALAKGKTLKTHSCSDLTFASDSPGVSLQHRKVYYVLSELLLEAQKEVYGESPYFIVHNDGLELLKELQKKKIKTLVLTNGLYSTDAYYTISALYASLTKVMPSGSELWAYSGELPDRSEFPKDFMENFKTSNRWGTHSKRAVVDEKHLVIGTYNVDPRSANLNSEMILICRNNSGLAKDTKANILKRLEKSAPVIENSKLSHDALFAKSTFKQKLLFWLAIPLASSFSFLL